MAEINYYANHIIQGTLSTSGTITSGGTLTVQNGNINLGSGTGRIQGVDTVSASTDAANKAYVDASVPSVGNGTFTVSGNTGLSGSGSMTANQSGNSSATLTNTDRGSSQAIFKNVAVSGQSTVVAASNNDTLTLVASGGMTITTNATTDTITFNPNDNNDNFYLNGISKSGNTLTFSVLGAANQPYTFGSNAFNSTTIATNNNQLTNGAGYITSASLPSVGNGQIDGRTTGSGLSGSMDATANQSGNTTFTVNSNATTAATASTIAYRDSAGDLNVRLLRANYANQSTISGAMAFRVNNSSDNYTRYCSSPSAIRTFIGAVSSSGVTSVATAGSVNGLTLTGGTITSTGTITLGGTLSINGGDWSGTDLSVANGGTGASTASAARTNLGVVNDTGTPAILSNGTVPSLNSGITATEVRNLIGAGTSSSAGVTSVATSGSVNGITLTGGTITSTGTITLGGSVSINNGNWSGTDLSVANGGTGSSTASGARTNLGVVNDTGTPAILSNGSTPTLNSGISATEVRNLIGAGTSSSAGVTSIATSTGLSGGTITSTGTLTNTDRGSSQNIFKNFTASSGGTATANSNNDTLTIAAGTNVTTVRSGDTITINATNDGQGVTSIATGSGITGGTITSTGTLTVEAGNGLSQSSTGLLMSGSYTGDFTASGDITIGGRDLIFSNTGTNDANITSSLGINFIVGSSGTISGLEIDTFGGVTTYNVLTTGGSIIVGGGGIQLNGTGRIEGIDTITASTDAVNKAYVDARDGTMSNWKLTADSGGSSTIVDLTVVDIAGGTNISTAISGNTLTVTNGITNNNQLTNGAGYTTNAGTMTGFGVAAAVGGSTFTITNGQTLSLVGGTNITAVFNSSNESITFNNDITNNNQLTNGAGYTTNTGTVTGSGATNRVPFWSSSSALSSNAAFTFISNVLYVDSAFHVKTGSTLVQFASQGDTDTGLGNFDGSGQLSLLSNNKAVFTGKDDQNIFNAYVSGSVATTGSLNPNQSQQAPTSDTLAVLAVDPAGNIVRGSQEGTWTFTKAQLDALTTSTTSGTTLIAAPGTNKAIIVEESNLMLKYSGTGSMSTNSFVIRQGNNGDAAAEVTRLPSGQIDTIMSSAPANPSYGFYSRDLPLYNNDGRSFVTNKATFLTRITTNATPSNLISISIKLKYRIFNATTF